MGQVCEVAAFLELFNPVNEIPVAKCGTVYTSPIGQEYLLVRDQMLWFGKQLPNSLMNLNQIHAFGIDIQDNPFDPHQELGMNCDDIFILFSTTWMIVHLETRAPTDWEIKHLPIIFLTGDEWDPSSDDIYLIQQS